MGIATAITAVAAVAAGSMAANATKKAADKSAQAVTDASDKSTQLQREALQYASGVSLPQVRAGAQAQARQMLMAGIPASEVKAFLQQTNSIQPFGTPGATSGVAGSTYAPTQPGQTRTGAGFMSGVDPRFTGQVPDALLELMNQNQNLGAGVTNMAAPNTGGASAGAAAEDPLAWIDSFDPQSFLESTPGYQFRMGEGQKALERSAASRGKLFSGQLGKELTRYGQGVASDYWDDLYNEYGVLAGTGQTAGRDLNQGAAGYADAASRNLMAAGNARASAYQQQGQADANFWGRTIPGAVGVLSGGGWFG